MFRYDVLYKYHNMKTEHPGPSGDMLRRDVTRNKNLSIYTTRKKMQQVRVAVMYSLKKESAHIRVRIARTYLLQSLHVRVCSCCDFVSSTSLSILLSVTCSGVFEPKTYSLMKK